MTRSLQLTKKLWPFQGDPINIPAATKLLGHTRPWTTKRYYNHAQAIDASRRYHGRLSELRDRLGYGLPVAPKELRCRAPQSCAMTDELRRGGFF